MWISQNSPERRLRLPRVPRGPAPQRHRFRPRLEGLEDRTVPSTLTVTNNLDSGAGSLRAAIKAASSGDTIEFAHTLAGQTITLTSGELAVTKNLDIEGLGTSRLTISGNSASRVFDLSGGVTVTVADLTITHGLADHGGAILNEAGANLTLADVTLSHNHATGGLGGGAIFNDAGASLSIKDSSLTNNQATTAVNFDPTTGGGGGGAIFNDFGASLSLTDCGLSGNQAVTTVGFDNFGGAIYNLGGTTTITDCTLENNQVSGGGSSTIIAGSVGGAVENMVAATLTVTNSRFSNNQAISAAGGYYAYGGALGNDLGSAATLSNSQFTQNQAVGSGAGGFTGGFGGGFENEIAGGSGTSTITDCAFLGNLATGVNGGAIGQGGAILVDNGSVSLTRSTVADNRAVGADGGVITSTSPVLGFGSGGGIAVAPFTITIGTPNLTVNQCTLWGNQAIGGNGGSGNSGASPVVALDIGAGGGLWDLSGIVDVNGSTFADNQALGGAGSQATVPSPALPAEVGDGIGGGLDNLPFAGVAAIVTVTNCTFVGNVAHGGNGNTVPSGTIALTGQGEGGGMSNLLSGTVASVSNCTFTGNQAVGGAGNTGGLIAGAGIGGGFLNRGGATATLSNCIISHNQAVGGSGNDGSNGGDGLGGGIANILGSTLTVTNCRLDHNGAVGGAGDVGGNGGNGFGGGIYNDGSTAFGVSSLTITGSTIFRNDADGGAAGAGGSDGQGIGGGLYLASGGIVCLDTATVAKLKKNRASTSHDDIFGAFTTC